MTIEMMMDEVIKSRGFEDKWTIWFCEVCEAGEITNLDSLQMLMTAVIAMSVDADEEE